jgi:hypothetical protein
MSQQQHNSGFKGQPEPQNEKKTYEFRVYFQTGGAQPETLDEKAINHFFTGNIAKAWAIDDGFFASYENYRDGKLHFKLIADPRFNGNDFLLALRVAREFKSEVNLLKEAVFFEARHFKANDIIGCNIPADTAPEIQRELSRRTRLSYDNLPAIPQKIHYGKF